MSPKLDADQNKDFSWAIENLGLQIFSSYLRDLDSFITKEIKTYIDAVEKAKQPNFYVIDGEEYNDIDDLALSNYMHSLFMYENFRNLFLKSFITNLYTVIQCNY